MLVTDPSAFGSYGFAPPQAQPGNWLTAGLASGWHQGLGMLGGAGQAATQARQARDGGEAGEFCGVIHPNYSQ